MIAPVLGICALILVYGSLVELKEVRDADKSLNGNLATMSTHIYIIVIAVCKQYNSTLSMAHICSVYNIIMKTLKCKQPEGK